MSFFVVTNKKEALKELVVFQKIKKTKDITFIQGTLCGFLDVPSSKVVPKNLLSEKDNSKYIFKGLGKSTFSSIPQAIPRGFKKVERTDDHFSDAWALNHYLSKYITPEKIASLNSKGFELNAWIQHYQSQWLTIADVLSFPLNKEIKFLLLDRNIYDDKAHLKEATLYSPRTFFAKNIASYWRTDADGLKGQIQYSWSPEKYDIEFDIEYKPNQWYPLTNGILPGKDQDKIFKLLGKDKSWNKFPVSTHIGLRGPIIVWTPSIIKNLAKVYMLDW
jgi:hypothetical protein